MRAAVRAPSASTGLGAFGLETANVIASAIMSGVEVGEIHFDPRAIAAQAVGDMEVLLEMVSQREIDERRAGGGKLHAGGEPALDQRQITGCKMPVKIGDKGPHLNALRCIQRSRIDARPSDHDHA